MSIRTDGGAGEDFALPDRMPGAPKLPGGSGQPGRLRHERHSCTVFGGLAGSEQTGATDIQSMNGLIPHGYPALVTGAAYPRYLAHGSKGLAHGLTLHAGQLVVAQGTGLYAAALESRTTLATGLSNTDKRFASLGDQLLILPDQALYDATAHTLTKLPLDTGYVEDVDIDNVYLTVSDGSLYTQGFRVGDCVQLEIQGNIQSATLNGYYKLSAVTETYLCVEGGFPARGSFTVRIRRVMPDLEGVCALGDRLYGFAGRRLYACEAGNPRNWYATRGLSADAAPFSRTTEGGGAFTACIVWQGYLYLFREDGLSRLAGGAGGMTAQTATLISLSAPGLPAAQAETLCELDGVLYYNAGDSVYRYGGSTATRVDTGLPEGIRGVCAGTDGRVLYLSAVESGGVNCLYLYHPAHGWYRQLSTSISHMLSRPVELTAGQGEVCVFQQDQGTLWLARSQGADWDTGFSTSLTPSAPGAMVELGDDLSLMPDGGRLLTVHIRAKGASRSQLKLYVCYDGGEWFQLATLAGNGREKVYHVPVPPRPCSWFRFRLNFSGAGTPGAVDGVFRVSGLWWDTERREAF